MRSIFESDCRVDDEAFPPDKIDGSDVVEASTGLHIFCVHLFKAYAFLLLQQATNLKLHQMMTLSHCTFTMPAEISFRRRSVRFSFLCIV